MTSTTATTRSLAAESQQPLLWLAAACSLAASAVHAAMLGSRWDEYWAYGLFFAAAASSQLAWAMAAAIRSDRLTLLLGVAGNLAITVMWVLTRTSGIPIGPSSGEAESMGFADVLTVALQLGVVLLGSAFLAGVTRLPAKGAAPAAAMLLAGRRLTSCYHGRSGGLWRRWPLEFPR